MKNLWRIAMILLALALLLSACSGGEDAPAATLEPTQTEPPTETPTEAPTEAPTETPTEEPTEAPTEAPTEEIATVPALTPTFWGQYAEGYPSDPEEYEEYLQKYSQWVLPDLPEPYEPSQPFDGQWRVETAYQGEVHESNGAIDTYSLPYIVLPSEEVDAINEEIYRRFLTFAPIYGLLSYDAYQCYGNILTVDIHFTQNPELDEHVIYTINIAERRLMTQDELLAQFGLTHEEFSALAIQGERNNFNELVEKHEEEHQVDMSTVPEVERAQWDDTYFEEETPDGWPVPYVARDGSLWAFNHAPWLFGGGVMAVNFQVLEAP